MNWLMELQSLSSVSSWEISFQKFPDDLGMDIPSVFSAIWRCHQLLQRTQNPRYWSDSAPLLEPGAMVQIYEVSTEFPLVRSFVLGMSSIFLLVVIIT